MRQTSWEHIYSKQPEEITINRMFFQRIKHGLNASCSLLCAVLFISQHNL